MTSGGASDAHSRGVRTLRAQRPGGWGGGRKSSRPRPEVSPALAGSARSPTPRTSRNRLTARPALGTGRKRPRPTHQPEAPTSLSRTAQNPEALTAPLCAVRRTGRKQLMAPPRAEDGSAHVPFPPRAKTGSAHGPVPSLPKPGPKKLPGHVPPRAQAGSAQLPTLRSWVSVPRVPQGTRCTHRKPRLTVGLISNAHASIRIWCTSSSGFFPPSTFSPSSQHGDPSGWRPGTPRRTVLNCTHSRELLAVELSLPTPTPTRAQTQQPPDPAPCTQHAWCGGRGLHLNEVSDLLLQGIKSDTVLYTKRIKIFIKHCKLHSIAFDTPRHNPPTISQTQQQFILAQSMS